MKISWRLKVIITTTAIVTGAIAITWMLNKFFLEEYYIRSKVDTLSSAFGEVSGILTNYYVKDSDESADAGQIVSVSSLAGKRTVTGVTLLSSETAPSTPTPAAGDDFDGEFRPPQGFGKGIQSFGFGIYEISSDNFLTEEDFVKLEMLASRSNLTIYVLVDSQYYFSTTNANTRESVLYQRIRSELTGNPHDRAVLKKSDEGYEITKSFDMRTNSTYLDLFSSDAQRGTYILIRTSVESMRESADIASGFLLYAGLIVLVCTFVIISFTTRSFVRPINQLSTVAKSVSRLDFDVRYTGDTNDEIGELGAAINAMSEKLEKTIVDLKNANNTLQNDIDQKVQIDEMRKEFLSNVTHELKTPIALISGYAEGLKDCINDDPESRDFYCDVIIDESDKMNKMVKKLLTLNQIEFGRQIAEIERFDLAAVIRSVIASSDVLLKNKEIKLLCSMPERLDAWADEYMIEEVFTNYLTNAINHCDGEKVIDVKASVEGETVRVSVFNTGEPIPEEDIDKIWIKFYKVDKARSREYGGSGIGLSIVKAIMDAHNKPFGVIDHSNGVEFWFELDAAKR